VIIELKDPIFTTLQQVVAKQKVEAYLVGGYVRDLFLQRVSKDIDVVVVGDGIALAKAFAQTQPRSEFAFSKTLVQQWLKPKIGK
jgi:poly(A) polymerase